MYLLYKAFRHRLLWLFIVVLTAQSVQAQDTAAVRPKQGISLGLYHQQAFILRHSGGMKHLSETHPAGAELNIQLQTTGAQPWHQLYHYPSFGVNLVYFDYHNPILGRSYAVSVYLSKAMLHGKKHTLNFRLGTGLAYFDRKFDLQQNHKNSIVSQSVNAVMQTRLEYEWKFTDRCMLSAGLGLNHYSNGATSKPNLGINLPTATLGLNTTISQPSKPLAQLVEPINKQTYLLLSGAVGYKQLNFSDRHKYLAYTASAYAYKPLNHKSEVLAGVDLFYDRSLLAMLKEDTVYSPATDVKRAAIVLGHELVFGHLSFQTHLGIYVYRPYKVDRPYYERLGVKYYFSRHLFAAIDLKVHRGVADYIEWTSGYRF